jgi:hypothetical protein
VAIILMAIVAILLMAIDGIGGYFINGYWWLFHCKLLVVIDGYCINDY